jgi:hypothetical protein
LAVPHIGEAAAVRINIDTDDTLLAEAMAATGLCTKHEVVEAGCGCWRKRQADVRKLLGASAGRATCIEDAWTSRPILIGPHENRFTPYDFRTQAVSPFPSACRTDRQRHRLAVASPLWLRPWCGKGTAARTERPAMAPAALVLKITLRGLRPPVWRRVRVPRDITLRMLHRVIQAAMAWQDYHLHEFEIGDRRYGEPDDEALPGDERTYNESNVKLGALIDRGVERFRYVYDFGDGWEHEIVVEKALPLDPERPYPSLVTGKRACPPEDCGGVYGYLRLLEILADPRHEEHAELSEWAGEGFDPERLDLDAIRRDLVRLVRRPSARRSRQER